MPKAPLLWIYIFHFMVSKICIQSTYLRKSTSGIIWLELSLKSAHKSGIWNILTYHKWSEKVKHECHVDVGGPILYYETFPSRLPNIYSTQKVQITRIWVESCFTPWILSLLISGWVIIDVYVHKYSNNTGNNS